MHQLVDKLVHAQNDGQQTLLQSIIDHTKAGLVLARPIYDAEGQIIDFRYVLTNAQNARTVGRTMAELANALIGDLFPGWQTSDFFQAFARVAQTGQTEQVVFPFDDHGIIGWFDGSFSRVDDCVLYTYLDVTALKEAELQAQKQADLLASIQNTSRLGIAAYKAVRDENGAIIDFKPIWRNAESVHMTGAVATDAQSVPIAELLPTLKQTGLIERYKQVLESGQAMQFEHYHPHDGVEEWFEITAQPFDGGVLVNVLETTELRRAERDRLEQAELMQFVLNQTQVGVILSLPVQNEQGHFLDFTYELVNEFGAQLVGKTVDEMVGKNMSQVFPDWRKLEAFGQYIDVYQTGVTQRVVVYYEGYGAKGWFDVSTSRLNKHILITYADVTALKEAEQWANEQSHQLRGILDAIPSSLFVSEVVRDQAGKATDFRLVEMNQVALALAGLPLEQVKGRLASEIFPQDRKSGIFDRYVQVVDSKEPQYFELSYQFSNHNQVRWFDVRLIPLGDHCIISSTTEITDRKQAELEKQQQSEQLELTNFELKRSNESLQSFAYIASHDLQEPLRKITSFSDILFNQFAGQFDPNATDLLRRMNSSALRMRQLIQDLLTYARVETQREAYLPVDLTKLTDALRENELWEAFYRTKAQLHRVDLPLVKADPFQMRQLFQNLLSNAIKFTASGTTPVITITSRVLNRPDIPAGLLPPSSTTEPKTLPSQFYEISVSDNGIGFDHRHEERVFQIFQRLNNRSQYEGTGIGLAICKKILERHEGAITVHSELGKGSTFRIYLPCA